MKTNSCVSRTLILVGALTVFGRPAEAQRAFKVKDINATVNAASGFPTEYVELGSQVIFAAVDASDERELWITDGTDQGTHKLSDINPGVASSNPTNLMVMNGAVYFVATNGVDGFELWRTDGTSGGTSMVKDITPGYNYSGPSNLAAVGNRLYFSANDGVTGWELWSSDGTAEGTASVKDLVPGPTSSNPSGLVNVAGTLYFTATTPAAGSELWRSDGTDAGTFMVQDVNAGASGSAPAIAGSAGGLVFFTASSAASGRELWATDGTSATAYQVIDLVAGSGSTSFGGSIEYGGYLYFSVQQGVSTLDGLWRTDGTEVGTTRVTYLARASGMILNDGLIYFCGRNTQFTDQLYRSDGTEAGTYGLSGVPTSAFASCSFLTGVGNTVFFVGNDQIWASDGTGPTTRMVKDILPGTPYSNLRYLTAGLGRLFFTATDLVYGAEPWISDGTTEGTTILKDVRISPNSGSPSSFAELNGNVLFAANDGVSGPELWQSDGTEAGTVLVKDLTAGAAGASPSKLTRSGDYVYFVGSVTTTSSQLWRTDGTSAGTFIVGSFLGTSSLAVPDKLTDVNGTLYFVAASSSSTGVELFKSTGSSVALVKDLRSFYGSNPDFLTPLGNDLYFGATDNAGYKLFKTDGTAAGTVEATHGPVPFSGASRLVNAGGTLFFSAQDPTNGFELWTTDGTASGTYMVADINPAGSSSPANITVVDGAVYFTATDGVTGVELWKSDGTAGGTVQVADLNPGAASSAPESLKGAGGLLYFTATDGAVPVMWSTDGTAGGTLQIRDVATGASLTSPSFMTDAHGTMLFQADDGVSGAELWSSDGASGSAFMIQDINPGASSSAPSSLTFAGGRLYFAANDGASGVELWSLSNQGPVANAGADQTVTEGSVAALSAAASTDPDADALTYEWRDANGVLVGRGVEIAPVVPPGQHEVTLIVRDGFGGMATDSVIVTVSANLDLTIEASGLRGGSGGIQADAHEICGNAPGGTLTCTYGYTADSVAHLVAVPSPLSVFGGWTGACAASGTSLACDVTMSAAVTVGATFLGPNTLTMNVVSVDNGLGTAYASTAGGESVLCDAVPGTTTPCTLLVREGDSIALGALPGTLSILSSIAGCAADPIDPNGSGCAPFTISGPTTVDVAFRGPQTLTVQVASLEDGLGYGSGWSAEGLNLLCDGVAGTTTVCTAQVRVGDTVQISALPGLLSVLSSIEGCIADPLDPNGAGCNPGVVMTGPTTITATFRGPQTLTVQVASLEDGLGYASGWSAEGLNLLCDGVAGTTTVCTAQVRVGDTVQISALPGSLSVLSSIEGCIADPLDPNGAGCNPGVVMTGPTTITVTFRGPQTLTVQVASLENGLGYASGWSAEGLNLLCDGVPGTTTVCTAQVRVGDTVQISALPDLLSVLDSIDGCIADPLDPSGAGCNPGVVIAGPTTITATFRGPRTLTLQVESLSNGVGVLSAEVVPYAAGALTNCYAVAGSSVTCTAQFRHGSTLLISALPIGGSGVQAMTGCTWDPASPVPTCPALVLSEDRTVTVSFLSPQTLTIQVASVEAGYGGVVVTTEFAGVQTPHPYCAAVPNTTATCVYEVNARETVFVSATDAASPSVIESLTGCAIAPIIDPDWNCVPFSMTAPQTVTLTLRGPQILTVALGGSGSGSVTWATGPTNLSPCFTGAGPCSYEVKIGAPQTLVATASADSLFESWTGACAGQGDTCSLTLTDDVFTEAVFVLRNQPPLANAGGPYLDVRGQPVTFNGGASSDPDGDALTYAWDFGDGATGTGVAPTHAYATTGTFAVTLTVNDGTVNSAPATSTVTISNQPPTANAGGPYAGVRGQVIAFSGGASADPDGDALTYEWDFGDGVTGTGVAPTHAYATTGTFAVTLTVNDGTADSTPAATATTISNQPPTANAGGPYAGTRLAAIAFNGSASSDPDGDPLTYAWAFGDGGTGTGATPTHLYAAVGTYTVTLTVNDGAANSTPSTSSVEITNVAPTVTLTSPAPGSVFNAPAAVTVSAQAADPDGSVTKVEFYAGAAKVGEALNAPYSILWLGAAPGSYSLTAVVTDSSGTSTTSTPVGVVLNAPPTVAITFPANGAQYAAPASITISANAVDADGAVAQVQFFRDSTSLGTDTTSPYSVTWAGATAGSYTLTAVAMDNRGAVLSSVPITVKVTAELSPVADSYVRASKGNSNYGTATTVTVQEGSSNSSQRWTYIKFDLTSVPSVSNAKLRVYGGVSATTGTTIETAVYAAADTSWTENGIKWNNKPPTGTTELATVTIVNNSTSKRWYELDVTAYLQAEKAAGRNVVTLALKNLASSSPYVTFTSKEGTAANRPRVLVVP